MHPTHDPKACWITLGIDPTTDDRAIRRTYATLLKSCRPDDNPEGFKVLREALETALWQAHDMREVAAMQPPAEIPDSGLPASEKEIELRLRPFVEKLAELNETASSEDTMDFFANTLTKLGFDQTEHRHGAVWEMFEDGMVWVCCEINANHDAFVRECIDMFGWLRPGHWLAEKDPKTVAWLHLRLQEADALEQVDELIALLNDDQEDLALAALQTFLESELLINLDVRLLTEAELMVALSALSPAQPRFAKVCLTQFGWAKDHRHLEEYHPEAWTNFRRLYMFAPD
ncbi:hypothetical protein KSF73_01475 [Burkholderiaceae bacterium DAT-1]|nr:hypothetical protein [Burkholderiaceae bacterium DAT-1]